MKTLNPRNIILIKMKNLIPILTLLAVTSFGAEPATSDDSADTADEAKPNEPVLPRQLEQTKRAQEKAVRAMEEASRTRERAMRQAERAMEQAKAKVAMAEDNEMTENIDWQDNINENIGVAFSNPGKNLSQPLVVRTKELDANAAANLQEDLAVMSRILTKTLGREARDSAMGIVLSALPGSRRPQGIYLENYGALFLVSVKIPLLPPPSKEDEKAEKASDSTWEQTKREMYGQKSNGIRVFNFIGADAAVEYDADKVTTLKKELIDALKNASHLRNLKPEESVTIVVNGGQAGGFAKRVKAISRNNIGRKNELYDLDVTDNSRSPRESTMTLRVKKADVDAFAKGELDREQFGKRVDVLIY